MNSQWNILLEEVAAGRMVRTDSRLVEEGDVFVAISGTREDGIRYIPQALEKKASYVVVPRGVDVFTGEAVRIEHPSPRKALGKLASRYFKTNEHNMKIVGVTGTNGKTTVTYIVEHALKKSGLNPGIMGTVSTRWLDYEEESSMTTPDCWRIHEALARMARDGVHVVCMEVSSHGLDQNRVAGIDFDVVGFTNLSQDHLDYHHDMESYFQVKRQLFREYETFPPFGVVNVDDSYGTKLASEHDPVLGVTFTSNGADQNGLLMGEIIWADRKGLGLKVRHGGRTDEFSTAMIGSFNGYNMLIALGMGYGLGMYDAFLSSFPDFAGVPGRLQRVPNNRGVDIFVDYAHTPDALDNVLRVLSGLDFKRIITLFGCGGDRDKAKRPLMGKAVARYSQVAVLTSDNPRNEDPGAIIKDVEPGLEGCEKVLREPDRREAIGLALQEMNEGDVLLVAGKGHENYQQIGDVRIPFDDTQIIMEYLA